MVSGGMIMPNFSGRVVIVTGGAQGIGKGIAANLLRLGAIVVIADIDKEAGEECVAEFEGSDRVHFIPTDVSIEDSVRGCISETAERCGNIYGLVNNAGIADPGGIPIEEATLESWQRMIDVNLTGCFLMAKYAVPYLRKTRGGIVNIASSRALQSEAHTEAYSASKGGLVALTHALAVSLGPDVRVNCVSPGWIDVSMWKKRSMRHKAKLSEIDHSQHPAGRVGKPGDVAAMVAFLLSEEAGFITGQNFVVDGGMTRKMIYAS